MVGYVVLSLSPALGIKVVRESLLQRLGFA